MSPADEPATELLLLDLDGTLVDSFADIERGIAAALAAIEVAPTAPVLALCRRGVGLEIFYQAALGRAAEAPGEADRFACFAAAYRGAYLADQRATRPYAGVGETLARIRARPVRPAVAVATAKRTEMARAVLARCGLADLIDHVVGCEGLPHKPDPAVLRRAAAEAGARLSGALMVGDTDRDLLAARAAGCRFCAVTYGGWTREELAPLAPDHFIDRFSDLEALL